MFRVVLSYILWGLIIIISVGVGFGAFLGGTWLLGEIVRGVVGMIGIAVFGLILFLPGFLTYEVLTNILDDYLP